MKETDSLKALIACAIVLLPMTYFSYENRGYQLDDALIYARYVQNFLAGDGLVYNRGEYFNALSSPMYSYLSSIASLLAGNIQRALIILSTICTGLSALILMRIFSRYEKPSLALMGALLMVCFPYCYSVYGMETPQFIFLLALCLYLYETNNLPWLGVSLACLILTRGEGIFLALAMSMDWRRRKMPFPKIKYFVLPALILSIHYAGTFYYYGSFFPHTIAAKIYQGRSGLWGRGLCFLRIPYQFDSVFSRDLVLLCGVFGLALYGVLALRSKSITIVSMCFLGCYTAFFTVLNIPSYHWYYAPYYTFAFFYASVGASSLRQRFQRATSPALRVSGTILAFGVMALLIGRSFRITLPAVACNSANSAYRDIGLWLRDNTPPNAKIAAVEIGAVGFYSHRYIIDILGLVTPGNARSFGKRRFNDWFKQHPPDYILAHDPFIGHERSIAHALKRKAIVEENRFHYPGYRLYVMAPKP